ncbi:MAG: hypothetical protein H6623_02865 [Bdellovibrionaceae bacterium]|nr:hypothetical protein [Pseudobdellovibrionaceae bacterium]
MRLYSIAFLLAVCVAAVSCGQKSRSESLNEQPEIKSDDEREKAKIFEVIENTQTVHVRLASGELVSGGFIAGSNLIVTGKTFNDDQNKQWLEVISVADGEESSETLYIQESDLVALPVKLVVMQDTDGLLSTNAEGMRVVQIGDRQMVVETIDVSRMTYCYKYVKLYLLKKKLVSVYLPGGSAYMAASILPKYNFARVSRGPSQAIVHDVCVYKGGPAGHGHIEVKTSQGWYYGYGYKSASIKNRIFIGCFHKK